jgi:glycosyltransferase involved in cell wall biosynthesis
MKIGVDASCWGNKRGFGRFTRDLLGELLEIDAVNEYLFFIDAETARETCLPKRARTVIAETETSQIKAASADGRRSIRDLWAMSRAVGRHQIDVFFFPAVYSYFPILNRAKIVVTLHDVIADHNPNLIFPNRKAKFFWKLKQNIAVRQADAILTVSEYSKRQIAGYFNLPEERLRVINEAARPIFKVLPRAEEFHETLEKYGLNDEKFLLYVGGISPHKNLDTLIAAFGEIARKHAGTKLVLVGDYKDDPFFSAYPSLKKQIAEIGLTERVFFTGFVPDEDLVALYNAAALLVFPSLEEGFGLPAMEAMACGTPVAASDSSSLPEVLGEAGRFFDPRDREHMASVVLEILENDELRGSMKAKGLRRAGGFTWEKAAADTLAIFGELAGAGSKKMRLEAISE